DSNETRGSCLGRRSWPKFCSLVRRKWKPDFRAAQLPRLFREMANAEGDGQADNEHVHQQTLNEAGKLKGPAAVKSREGNNNEIHHEKNSDAKEQAAYDRVLLEESKLAARSVIHGRRGGGDKQLQKDAESVGSHPAMNGLPAEQSCGNCTRHPHSISNERGNEVEPSRDQTANENGRQGPRATRRYRCRSFIHIFLRPRQKTRIGWRLLQPA